MANSVFRTRCSFGGLEFPVASVRMRGSYRHHEHVYLKTPGAATEKMSRGLYRMDVSGVFDGNITGYGDLSATLAALRRMYESGTTAPFVHPSIGSIPCWIPDWDQHMEAKVTSQETAQLLFQEDNSVAFLENALKKVSSTSIASSHAAFQLAADTLSPRPSIFDQIQDAANRVLAIFDQAQLEQALVIAKIDGLSALIRAADQDVQTLQDPSNFSVVYALQDLLAANLELGRSVTLQQGELRQFVVPSTMTLAQVSVGIYGDATHTAEILANNAIEDPFNIIAGTTILYFATGILHAA